MNLIYPIVERCYTAKVCCQLLKQYAGVSNQVIWKAFGGWVQLKSDTIYYVQNVYGSGGLMWQLVP